jgi:hypothetical protein
MLDSCRRNRDARVRANSLTSLEEAAAERGAGEKRAERADEMSSAGCYVVPVGPRASRVLARGERVAPRLQIPVVNTYVDNRYCARRRREARRRSPGPRIARPPVFTTAAAAARLSMSNAHASVSLARLHAAGHLVRLRRGVWAFPDRVDALALPEFLTAPFPAYVSLQSGADIRGDAGPVAPSGHAARNRVASSRAAVVLLRLQEAGRAGGRLATPEKALVDFLYLASTRSRLFRALPELEWPKAFKASVAREVARRIEPASRRRAVARKLEELLAGRARPAIRAGGRSAPGACPR